MAQRTSSVRTEPK